MVHGPDGPGPFLFRSDIGDDALAPISVGRGPSMALPWAIPILLPAARHVIGSGPHADIGFVAGGPIMFLYMPIDDRTSLSVSSVMAVGFGIGSPMEGRPDLIRSVSSLRDSAEVSPPGSRPMA